MEIKTFINYKSNTISLYRQTVQGGARITDPEQECTNENQLYGSWKRKP